ncbi:hypothetical protein TNCV_2276321 [Trichonephila clavipes]|nr:hypothetical protein TNCV_2276321 [Trichonephila clavipes]
MIRARGHGTTPLRVKEDIEDVSCELDSTSWMKRPELYCSWRRGRIIGKIEEGRKITDVAREIDIAHSVVSRLWKSFKTTGMCSRLHGEVVLEVRRLQKTDISSYQQKGTGAPQLSRWQISFLLPQESRSPEKLLPDV